MTWPAGGDPDPSWSAAFAAITGDLRARLKHWRMRRRWNRYRRNMP